ncbi:hypothetical protein, partial [Salmonella enterica]
LSPKNYGYQKNRQTLSDQPGKDKFLFFKRLRTRQDVPKLKSGSSDWTRTSSIAPAVSGFQKMVSVFTIIFTSIFNAVLP